MMNEMHHLMDQFYGRVSTNTTQLTLCFVHTYKLSVIVINLSLAHTPYYPSSFETRLKMT